MLGMVLAAFRLLAAPTSDDYYTNGAAASKARDWPAAVAAYTQCLQLNPADYRAYCERGWVEGSQVMKYYTPNQDGTPMKVVPFGDIPNGRNNLDAAWSDLTTVIKMKPDDTNCLCQAYFYRAMLTATLAPTNSQDALADVDMAIKLKPDFAWAYGLRGYVKRASGDTVGAVADFDKALQLEPSAGIYAARGELKKQLRDIVGGQADYVKAHELDPRIVPP